MASRLNPKKIKDNGLSKQCPKCGNVYNHRSGLMKHTRLGCKGVKPSEGPLYRCTNCPRVYKRKGDLTRHLKKCDGKAPRLPDDVWLCGVCQTTYSCRQNLHRHKKRHEGTEKQQYALLIQEAGKPSSTLANTMHRDLQSATDAFEQEAGNGDDEEEVEDEEEEDEEDVNEDEDEVDDNVDEEELDEDKVEEDDVDEDEYDGDNMVQHVGPPFVQPIVQPIGPSPPDHSFVPDPGSTTYATTLNNNSDEDEDQQQFPQDKEQSISSLVLTSLNAEGSGQIDCCSTPPSQPHHAQDRRKFRPDRVLPVNIIRDSNISLSRTSLPPQFELVSLEGENYAVLTTKTIACNTQLGPALGQWMKVSDQATATLHAYPTTFLRDHEDITWKIDRGNDHFCNWMKHVRQAHSFEMQNAMIFERDDCIFYVTCVDIPPRTELMVGYSLDYAMKYGCNYFFPKMTSQLAVALPYSLTDLKAPPSESEPVIPSVAIETELVGANTDLFAGSSSNCRTRDPEETLDTVHESNGEEIVHPPIVPSCPHCEGEFDSADLLMTHIEEHKTHSGLLPSPSILQKGFKHRLLWRYNCAERSEGNASTHSVNNIVSVRYSSCECPMCGECHATPEGWTSHIAADHPKMSQLLRLSPQQIGKRDKLQCTICDREFAYPKTFIKHLKGRTRCEMPRKLMNVDLGSNFPENQSKGPRRSCRIGEKAEKMKKKMFHQGQDSGENWID